MRNEHEHDRAGGSYPLPYANYETPGTIRLEASTNNHLVALMTPALLGTVAVLAEAVGAVAVRAAASAPNAAFIAVLLPQCVRGHERALRTGLTGPNGSLRRANWFAKSGSAHEQREKGLAGELRRAACRALSVRLFGSLRFGRTRTD